MRNFTYKILSDSIHVNAGTYVCKFDESIDLSAFPKMSEFTAIRNEEIINFDIISIPIDIYNKGKNIGIITKNDSKNNSQNDSNKLNIETYLFKENPFNMSFSDIKIPNNNCSVIPDLGVKYDARIGACDIKESKREYYEYSDDNKLISRNMKKYGGIN
jgi:hypothetical protein